MWQHGGVTRCEFTCGLCCLVIMVSQWDIIFCVCALPLESHCNFVWFEFKKEQTFNTWGSKGRSEHRGELQEGLYIQFGPRWSSLVAVLAWTAIGSSFLWLMDRARVCFPLASAAQNSRQMEPEVGGNDLLAAVPSLTSGWCLAGLPHAMMWFLGGRLPVALRESTSECASYLLSSPRAIKKSLLPELPTLPSPCHLELQKGR